MDRSASEIYRMLERRGATVLMRNPSGDRYALSLKLFAFSEHARPSAA